MISRKTSFLKRFTSLCFLSFLLITPILAQLDPNPNSPTPTLLSEKNSKRVLVSETKSNLKDLTPSKSEAFKLGSTIVVYISDVELMKDEGANAFRVYGKNKQNRIYRFPVESIERVHKVKPIFALTVKLQDALGHWKLPSNNGDLIINVTWRGLQSNSLLLGIGKIGGLEFEPETKSKLSKNNQPPTSNYVGYRWSGDRKRFLEQATFGSTTQLDWRVRRIGLRVWLAEQFEATYPSPANPYPNLELKPNQVINGCPFPRTSPEYRQCLRDFYSMYLLQKWFFTEAFYGEAQLKHRVSWALSQLWVTSGQTIRQASHMIEYHKVLSNNAFGNYRDLMKEMTLNPAMGDYLNMATSTKNNPNENYAREIMQLFTVGLFMLNQDGTLQLDENNEPIPTYNQDTVNNFTKVFTGWGFCNNGANPSCPSAVPGTVNFKDPLLLNQNNHDTNAKTLLSYPNSVNQNINAGLNGNIELDQALDNIFNHPNVAPFVSKFLIQHLVTSDPTPSYIGRISAVFNNNGNGVRGDMKAVVKAILLDPEARGDEKTDPNFGKLREPVQFTTNIYRNFGVRSADETQNSDGVVAIIPTIMGQNAFNAPTVFNYYTPEFTIPGTGLLAPEFGILNSATSINRMNAATIISFLPIEVDDNTPMNFPLGTSINVDEYTSFSQADPTGNSLVDALDRKLMHSIMPQEMKEKILTGIQSIPVNQNEFRARTAIFLIVSSSQYQIQR